MKRKIFAISAVIVLILAILPAASVFAAPPRDGVPTPTPTVDLPLEWKNKTRNLRFETLFYNRIQLLPADFEDKDELGRAYDLLHKYGFAVEQANAIVLKHAGFDVKGRVTNEIQADKTLKELAMYLHTIRAIRAKLEEADFPIRLK
jgi:hypothetical protein